MFLRTQLARLEGSYLFRRTPTILEAKKLYTPSHEWLTYDAESKIATIGISIHAQEQFGTVVYADLPEKGETLEQNKPCGNVESVKATSEILSPVSGVIYEVNAKAQENPALLNESPEIDGWLLKVQNAQFSEESLMDPEKYASFVETGKK